MGYVQEVLEGNLNRLDFSIEEQLVKVFQDEADLAVSRERLAVLTLQRKELAEHLELKPKREPRVWDTLSSVGCSYTVTDCEGLVWTYEYHEGDKGSWGYRSRRSGERYEVGHLKSQLYNNRGPFTEVVGG